MTCKEYCSECCESASGLVFDSELEEMAKSLEVKKSQLDELLTETKNEGMRIFPKKENDSCYFLRLIVRNDYNHSYNQELRAHLLNNTPKPENNKNINGYGCAIYESRPNLCRAFSCDFTF